MDGAGSPVFTGFPLPPIIFTADMSPRDQEPSPLAIADALERGGLQHKAHADGDDHGKDHVKTKGGAILHNLLHPLDYIHEQQAKRRSRNNSISSDCGDLSAFHVNLSIDHRHRRSKTPDPPRKSKDKSIARSRTPEPRPRSPEPWPVYRPMARQRPRPRNLAIPTPRSPEETMASPTIVIARSPSVGRRTPRMNSLESEGSESSCTESSENESEDESSKEWVPKVRTLGGEYKQVNKTTEQPNEPKKKLKVHIPGSAPERESLVTPKSPNLHFPFDNFFRRSMRSLSKSPRRGSEDDHHEAKMHRKDSLDSPSSKSPRRGSIDIPIFRSLRRGSVESPVASDSAHVKTGSPKDTLKLPKGHSPFDYFHRRRSVSKSPHRPVAQSNSSPAKHPHTHDPARKRHSIPHNFDNENADPALSFEKTRSHTHVIKGTPKAQNNSGNHDPDSEGESELSSMENLWQDNPDGNATSRRRKEKEIEKSSSVEKLYHIYDQIIKEGQLRRPSSDSERRRHGSGNLPHSYMRGEMDPNQAAILFRDSRGLPAADPFLDNISRSDLEQDESQIFVKFFKFHHTYDLIPLSAKLVVFDTKLQVKKAFYALVYNGVRAAPLWDSTRQQFVGMLTITDFIRILQNFYQNPNRKMEELEDHRLETWRTVLKDESRPLISIRPDESLYVAIRSLIHHKIHRLPVIDPSTGNVLYIVTHKRILKFLYLYINELPKPSILQKPLRDMNIGSYSNIQTASQDMLIIEALNKFVEHRISALPIVDAQGKLVDIYAKFDVINLAAEGTYNNLDVTLRKANEHRNKWFEEVHRCTLDETLGTVMERIVRAEVHRLVVVDDQGKVHGVISLSDILKELVLKPCQDAEPNGLKSTTISQMEVTLSGSEDPASTQDPTVNGSESPAPKTEDHPPPTPEVTVNGVSKAASEDSVADKWSSDDRLSQRCQDSDKAETEGSKVSPNDSEEEEWRYGMGEATGDPPQAKVIPITG